jgi:hypothetical protein
MKIQQTDLITVPRSRKPGHCHFIDGSDARIIISLDEAALIRLWTGGPSGAYAAKSPTAQALLLRPIRGKYSGAGHRRRQTATKLTTFMTGIRSFMKAYAILWQKLYGHFSEHTFDQGNRVLVSRVATHLDIRDRVSMKTGRLSQVPNRPIQRSTRHQDLCTCATVTSDKVTAMITMSPNQRGIR